MGDSPKPGYNKRQNSDESVVDGFGDEWSRFTQSDVSPVEQKRIFNAYFSIFPWEELSATAEGFDMGCGSGRWAKFVAPRVGKLNCVDPSHAALNVARANLRNFSNCTFECATANSSTLRDDSQDFGYCLGVLHHIPDTLSALQALTAKLKPGAPLLLYLYYSLENRPLWYRAIWRASNPLRVLVSRLPHPARFTASQIIAGMVYFPLARTALLLEKIGVDVDQLPLAQYRASSLYTMRTDALDRFGTRLEQRFSKAQISEMMQAAGLERITFSSRPPNWCVLGYKK